MLLNNTKQSPASLDQVAKWMTIGVVTLFVVIGSISVQRIIDAQGDTTQIIGYVMSILLFIAVFAFCYLFAPKSYSLNSSDLIIHRPIGNVVIPVTEIAEADKMDPDDSPIMVRTFGVGGLFGYYGKYYSPKLGKLTLYTTQRNNRVLVVMKNKKKILISPDDTAFADALTSIVNTHR